MRASRAGPSTTAKRQAWAPTRCRAAHCSTCRSRRRCARAACWPWRPRDPLRVQEPEARRQLETFASLVAIAVERMHYVDVAQNTLLQMESESLRNSLLAAISHDLRTPLTALVGLADVDAPDAAAATDASRPARRDMREEALRMSAMVSNLLDMARLQAGKVRAQPRSGSRWKKSSAVR